MVSAENEIDLRLILRSIFKYYYIFFIVLLISFAFFYFNYEKYNVQETTAKIEASLSNNQNLRELNYHWSKMGRLQELFNSKNSGLTHSQMTPFMIHIYDTYLVEDFFQID